MTETCKEKTDTETENEENMKVVLALKDLFEVDTRNALWSAVSKLKAEVDGGILKYDTTIAIKKGKY